jgi:AcrR family transcriptional regulator
MRNERSSFVRANARAGGDQTAANGLDAAGTSVGFAGNTDLAGNPAAHAAKTRDPAVSAADPGASAADPTADTRDPAASAADPAASTADRAANTAEPGADAAGPDAKIRRADLDARDLPGDHADQAAHEPDVEDEELSDEGRIRQLLVHELGEELADAFVAARETQERWARRRHPHEGLRERKKRRTRQQISDVATALFVVRGFDRVKVSQVADIVGVSEKTVYNYFPTKESLVFDRADETIACLVRALRERASGESPAKAVLRALADDMDDLEDLPDKLYLFLPLFNEMVAATPALRAAWLDLQGRLVAVATEELAVLADVDPRDPEPMVAARAIVGLTDLSFASRVRHIEQGLRGTELRDAVLGDLERAARLLDAGLWSFNLLTQQARTRQQMREAAAAAEDARRQVLDALRRARTAWHDLTRRSRADSGRPRSSAAPARAGSHQSRAEASSQQAGERREHGLRTLEQGDWGARARAEARREAGELGRAAKELALQTAYEAFRESFAQRHDAIRRRQAAIEEAARQR